MPPLNDPGNRGENIVAGTFLVVFGAAFAFFGITSLFSGEILRGAPALAGGGLMVVLAWRGHVNVREYLDERKRTGIDP